MNCINIAVVDDQQILRETVIRHIRQCVFSLAEEFRIESFDSAESYLDSMFWRETDLLFLDIELPQMNGVELSKRLANYNPNIRVVFLTSYEHYMKNAFGLNVLHYLMKDNLAEEVQHAMTTFMESRDQKTTQMITFRTEKNEFILALDQIVLVYVENRSVYVVTQFKQVKLSAKSIKYFYEKLNASIFIQPNSGYIVNMNYIHYLKGQEMNVKYYDKTIIVARRKVRDIQAQYLEYLSKGDFL